MSIAYFRSHKDHDWLLIATGFPKEHGPWNDHTPNGIELQRVAHISILMMSESLIPDGYYVTRISPE